MSELPRAFQIFASLVKSGQWAKMTDAERNVYGVYLAHSSLATAECWPGITCLSTLTGLQARSVKRAGQSMVRSGIIERRPRGFRETAVTTLKMQEPVTVGSPVTVPSPVTVGSLDRCPQGHYPGDPTVTTPVTPGSPRTKPLNQAIEPKPKNKALAVEVNIPGDLNQPAFLAAWEQWQQYRREAGKKLTPSTATRQLAAMAKIGLDRAIAAIDHSIENGWQGIYEQEHKNGHNNRTATSARRTNTPNGQFPEHIHFT